MAETSAAAHQSTLLGLFKKSPHGRLKAGDLKKKLKIGSKDGPAAPEADRAIADLIHQGLVKLIGGLKDAHHPRPSGSYQLTDAGKQHLKPARPNVETEILEYQESFILLQVFRSKEQKLTRSDLNGKLKSVAAVSQLEFDVKAAPETIDYHLARLVDQGCLDEERRGNSVGYRLNPEQGAKALVSARQHVAVSFTMTGQTLNALLEAARAAEPGRRSEPAPATEPVAEPEPTPSSTSLSAEVIARVVEQLRGDKYAGKDLIPIHEVRRLVADQHGREAASHSTFDPVLKRMRSDGQLDLIALTDSRAATEQEMNDSIPGLNETIFYVVVK